MTSPRDQGRNNQPYYPELTSPTSTHRTQRSQPDYQGHTGNDPTWISTASQLNDTSQPPPAQPPLSTRRSATPFPVQAVLSDSQSSSTQSGSRSSGSGSATLYEPYVPPSEEISSGAYAESTTRSLMADFLNGLKRFPRAMFGARGSDPNLVRIYSEETVDAFGRPMEVSQPPMYGVDRNLSTHQQTPGMQQQTPIPPEIPCMPMPPLPPKVVYPNAIARVPSDAQSSLHGYGGFAPTADSHHTGSHTLHSAPGDDFETGETTLVHHDPPPFPPPMPIPTMSHASSSPPYVNPRPSADYSKMPQPSRFSRLTHISLPRIETLSITSLTSRVDRLIQFFKDVYELPWVAPRITVDYVPGAGKSKIEGWYQDGRGSPGGRLDLMASPPAMSQRSEPRSGTSSSGSPQHSRRSNYIAPGEFDPYEDYQRSIQQPGGIRYPNGYAPSYAYQTRPQAQALFTPQQLYIYPGQQSEMQQARPIYFMAASPPSNPPFLPPGAYYPTSR